LVKSQLLYQLSYLRILYVGKIPFGAGTITRIDRLMQASF